MDCAREEGIGRERASGLGRVTFKEKAVMSRWREVGKWAWPLLPWDTTSSVTSLPPLPAEGLPDLQKT